MIQVRDFEQVTQFRMGRVVDGQVAYWCAAYLVDGLLIDTGCAHTAGELLAELRGRRVELVVNTHYHEDHTGANALLARELGLELRAPAGSLEAIGQGYQLPPAREMVWGAFEPSHPQPLGSEVLTGHHRFEVLATPGHSLDHVTLLEPEHGWAFVGDLWITDRPKTCRLEDDHNLTIDSLKRLRGSHPRVLFTGLGQIIEDAAGVLAGTIAYLEGERDRFLAMTARGLSPAEIVTAHYGRESSLHTMTSGEISYENFVRSFLPRGD